MERKNATMREMPPVRIMRREPANLTEYDEKSDWSEEREGGNL
jgi:hypothetical protein